MGFGFGSDPSSGLPNGGSLRVRPKALHRHVAELDALVTAPTLVATVEGARHHVAILLSDARAEVELNVRRSRAAPVTQG